MEEISVVQFEVIVTQRVLYYCMSPSAIRNGFVPHELISKASFIGSKTLYDYGFGDECQCQLRGTRIFLVHKRNKRIVAEMVLSADRAENKLCKRPQFYLMSRKGFVKQQKLSKLIGAVGKLDNYARNRR